MECRNCKTELYPKNNFCSECGAKIITERITIQNLLYSVIVSLGWDSNFFVTLRHLIFKPQIVIKEYVNGTRKKYANPFTFFAISLAISLFVISKYSEEFIQLSTMSNLEQVDEAQSSSLTDDSNASKGLQVLGFKNQEDYNKSIAIFHLKYYNQVYFLYLPIYAFIAFLVFRKPYNYGEHLIISTYILGITTFFGIVLFTLSLLTKINVYAYAILITFVYYLYVYTKLCALSFRQLLLKTLKLVGVILLIFTVFIIIGFIIGFFFAMKNS